MDNHFIVIAEAGDFIGEQKLIAQHLNGEMKDGQWYMADGSIWDIIVTGVGAINVMKTLRDLPRNAQIINIGYAGSANYEIGSVVCVREARLNHPCVTYPEPQLLLKPVPSEWLKSHLNVWSLFVIAILILYFSPTTKIVLLIWSWLILLHWDLRI